MANLKFHNSTTGEWEEIKVSTRLKDLYHTTKLTQDQNYVDIGVTNFNPNEDVVFSICNSTWLQRDDDYIVNDGLLRIESKDGTNWKNGDTFNFVVLKNVDKDALPSADGSLIQDGSITIAKLATTLQTAINKVGTAALTTSATTLSDAINELNTSLSDVAHKTGSVQTNLNADMVDGIQGNQIPLKTTANITYYVDTAGNDTTGDGSQAKPFKTINKALSMLPQIINHDVTINILSGTYNEPILVAGFSGKGSINVNGASNASDAVNFIVEYVTLMLNTCRVIISGFATNSPTNYSFQSYSNSFVNFINCISNVANNSSYGLMATNGGVTCIYGTTLSNRAVGIVALYGAIVISDTNNGSGNTVGLSVNYGGIISKLSSQPNGTTAETVYGGGVIR